MVALFALIFVVSVVAACARAYIAIARVRRISDFERMAAPPFNQPDMPFGVTGLGLDPQFMAMMQQIQTLVAQAQHAQASGVLPPHLQVQFNRRLAAANRQMRDLDALSRQRHEIFMADMTSQAASVGIDINSLNR